MTLAIGITGGIGSGKSTVCKIFKLIGIPVFEADSVAKELMNTNHELKQQLIHLFGVGIYTPDSGVDRKKLANIIFNDHLQLEKINALIHPVVRNEFEKWKLKQKSSYVIHEAAILFESGFYKMMDFTVLVSASENERIKRVAERDKTTVKQIKERIAKQWTDEQKRKLATVEIKNNNEELIIPQIIKIDKQIKKYGKIW